MLVLFESPAGYAVFKVLKESKIKEVDNIAQYFETPEKASKIVQLQFFEKFKDATEALTSTAASLECKLNKRLKKVVKQITATDAHEELGVIDSKLGNLIKEKLGLNCVCSNAITELYRNIKSQASQLIGGMTDREYSAIQLGLAHGLSRYKLKFNPDKIDTMIIQAVHLLEDLDKELNNYGMRLKEWYGWHFPEMSKIIVDNATYAKTVKLMGTRDNASSVDFCDILEEDVEKDLKAAADISMGTEISKEDIENVSLLCDQIIDMYQYRTQLSEYLQNRMMAVAPNLAILVGDMIGAKLIAHAGSLINLAKQPASTVQVFGAEKALFQAITKRQATPKFGLMYNASLVSQASVKYKGKISRMLAAKSAIAIRVDALKEDVDAKLGTKLRSKVEYRLRQLETGMSFKLGTARDMSATPKYTPVDRAPRTYDAGNDFQLESRAGKRKIDEIKTPGKKPAAQQEEVKDEPVDESATVAQVTPKKKKKLANSTSEEFLSLKEEQPSFTEEQQLLQPQSGKKKKRKSQDVAEEVTEAVEDSNLSHSLQSPSSKKKKKQRLMSGSNTEDNVAVTDEVKVTTEETTLDQTVTTASGKKKKKQRKSQVIGDDQS